MDKKHISLKDIVKAQSALSIVLSFLGILLFVALLSIYTILFMSSTDENIIRKGQVAAIKSAKELDFYLSECTNALETAEYELTNLIKNGRSIDEMQEFLVEKTNGARATLGYDTAAFYALINGELHDGSGWEPEEGYVSEDRPWYKQAMEKKGETVLVDPYTDIYSDVIVMTISRTLSDGKNVIALDVSTDHIQYAVEHDPGLGSDITEMVLDRNGTVVAHSDNTERGKNYSNESGTIGAAIANNLQTNSDTYFKFNYDGHDYTTYIVPIMGGWYSVSIVATANEYYPLRIMLFVSTIVSVATVLALIILLVRSGKKSVIANRLNAQLSTAADIYISVSDIDITNNSLIQIKDLGSGFISEMIGHNKDVQENFFTIMNGVPDNPTKQAAVDFVNLSTLDERLSDRNSISLEYLSYNDKWVRARFVVSERRPDGKLTHVLWMLEDIDTERRARDKLTEQTAKLTAQLSSAADIYISLCDLDIIDNSVTPIKNANPAIAKAVNSCDHNMQDIFFDIMQGLPESPTKQAAIDFCDLSDVDERLKDKNTMTLEYISYGNLWVRARYVVSERNEDGKITHVLWMLENIDAEKRASDRLSEVAEKLGDQMTSIANIYMSVYDFDLENDTFSEVRATNNQVIGIIGDSTGNAQRILFDVMKRMTDESALAQVLSFVDLSTIEKRLGDAKTITIEYLSKGKQWRRGRFIESGRSAQGRLRHVLWLVEDIDKERKDSEKLIDMSERAIAANAAKSAFLSNMSYEIRNPINTLLGMNARISMRSSDGEVLRCSEIIREAGTSLLELINDVLDFSKIEAGKMEIKPVKYDLPGALDELTAAIQPRLDEKGLMLIKDYGENLPRYLVGDIVHIKQIISNILSNAVKFTERGSITVSVSCENSGNSPDLVRLKVSVMDTGIGIKKPDMVRLFSQTELPDDVNGNVQGVGLGMSVTQSLLSIMGSKLEVESVYGVGSVFGFTLEQNRG